MVQPGSRKLSTPVGSWFPNSDNELLTDNGAAVDLGIRGSNANALATTKKMAGAFIGRYRHFSVVNPGLKPRAESSSPFGTNDWRL